jgi:hypothetical protein
MHKCTCKDESRAKWKKAFQSSSQRCIAAHGIHLPHRLGIRGLAGMLLFSFFLLLQYFCPPQMSNWHRSRRVINFGFTISSRELFFSLQASDEHVPSQHWLTRVKATIFDTNYPEESTRATPSSSVVDQHQYVLCIETHALSSFPACDQHLTGVTCPIAQGGISFRGVGRSVRGPTATRVPLAFGRSKNLGEGPASDTKPASAGPLVTPTQALEGASRWSSALLRVMPPFSSWMPPEAVAKAMDSLPPADAQQSAVQYSFPDALPKVRTGSHAGRTADVTSIFLQAGSGAAVRTILWQPAPALSSYLYLCGLSS